MQQGRHAARTRAVAKLLWALCAHGRCILPGQGRNFGCATSEPQQKLLLTLELLKLLARFGVVVARDGLLMVTTRAHASDLKQLLDAMPADVRDR